MYSLVSSSKKDRAGSECQIQSAKCLKTRVPNLTKEMHFLGLLLGMGGFLMLGGGMHDAMLGVG